MSDPSAAQMLSDKEKDDMVLNTAKIALTIRREIQALLPCPAEQFINIMIPGKVVNFKNFNIEYDSNGTPLTATTPIAVQLQEAMLCDDMPALGPVQLAPTGRSVSRAYTATLDSLVPSGTTVGINKDDPEEARYIAAMDYLTAKDPKTGETTIQVYTKYQLIYSGLLDDKEAAFAAALADANANPKNSKDVAVASAQALDQYAKWVQLHRRRYNEPCQSAYMNWVIMGDKEQVEYYFNVVDVSTVMARIESSKQVMRNSTISTLDGAAEYQTVILTPSNWAKLALDKANEKKGDQASTPESLSDQISNTQIELAAYVVAQSGKKNAAPAPAVVAETVTTKQSGVTAVPAGAGPGLDQKIQDVEDAQVAYHAAFASGAKPTAEDVAKLTAGIDEAEAALSDAMSKNSASESKYLSAELASAFNTPISDDIYSAQVKVLTEKIASLKMQLTAACKEDRTAGPENVPGAGTDRSSAAPPTAPNYWTSMSVHCAASDGKTHTDAEQNSVSVSGGVNLGFWSVGGSFSHSDSSGNASAAMSKCAMSATFECMRVDIARPWLSGDLFYDSGLRPANGKFISPGPALLAQYMDPVQNSPGYKAGDLTAAKIKEYQDQLAVYNVFPLYPTSFLLAANVVLEFQGDTSDISSHFASATTSGSASVSYGPFSVNTSFSHSTQSADATCKTTSNGCRITIHAPQIIGNISQMLPALPRRLVAASTIAAATK